MQARNNRRGYLEKIFSGRHLALPDLIEEARIFNKNIPPYPKPKFRVRFLKHDTDKEGLQGIRKSSGFIGRPQHEKSPSLLWWGLVVKPEDIEAAEQAFVDENALELMQGQHFLKKFATSPAFSEASRLGAYRFTFTVKELLEAYKVQICSGEEPMMRVFKTVLYTKEVVYVVLIHRPEDQEQFSEYPLLPREPGPICTYEDGQFVWRSEAMCETHRYQLGDQFQAIELSPHQTEFYLWDNVSIAFHLDKDEVLKFEHLGTRVTTCGRGNVFYGHEYDDPATAKKVIEELWPASSDKN